MNKFIFKEIENLIPQQTINVCDGPLGNLGYLSIDSLIDGRCCGGIRIHEDLSLEELNALSRAMTLKFGFVGIPKGGAKAGIIIKEEEGHKLRKERIQAFAQQLDYLIKDGIYLPGQDLGTSEEDLADFYRVLGKVYLTHEGNITAAMATSYSLYASIKAVLEFHGKTISGSTFAICGFGQIGQAIARAIHGSKGKIVGISNICGGLFEKDGIDVNCAISRYKKHGDEFVLNERKHTKINKEDLLGLDTDVLVPCAGNWTINSDNVDNIKARFILSGANVPITKLAEQMLVNKDIVVVPYFMSNSGGVLGTALNYLGFTKEEIRSIIEGVFLKKTHYFLKKSEQNKISLTDLATKETMKKFNKMKFDMERSQKKRLIGFITSCFKKVPLLKSISKPYVKRHIIKTILN